MNLNIPPFSDEYDDQKQPFSCQVFYDPTGFHRRQVYYTQYHHQDDNYSCDGVSSFDDEDSKVEASLKLTLWNDPAVECNPSLKKLEKSDDCLTFKIKNSGLKKIEVEDQKLQQSSSFETDLISNSSCNVNCSPIRVCSDCNTTKTPLWRSGPNGPKSLCNACGIRQRKARRAMAAAAVNSMAGPTEKSPEMKINVHHHKEKINRIKHATKFKKRSKITANSCSGSSSPGPKKLDLEDFLINLSKNLVFQRVFPQDEKDAAILLMALSSGLVHG